MKIFWSVLKGLNSGGDDPAFEDEAHELESEEIILLL